MTWTTLASKLDHSVNFTRPASVGIEECRFVWRGGSDFSLYLSTQTGCVQACKMCWLTATKQGALEDVSIDGLVEQAERVLEHLEDLKEKDPQFRAITTVNYAFMARGEPLASRVVRQQGSRLMLRLALLAHDLGLIPRFKVSTILPEVARDFPLESLTEHGIQPDMYYSLYSVDPAFRAKWLPNAMPAEEGLEELARYQKFTHKVPRIHYALIQGENDSLADARAVVAAVHKARLRADVNVVRFNPPEGLVDANGDPYVEASDEQMAKVVAYLGAELGCDVQKVHRVGPDAFASCGQFVPKPTKLRVLS